MEKEVLLKILFYLNQQNILSPPRLSQTWVKPASSDLQHTYILSVTHITRMGGKTDSTKYRTAGSRRGSSNPGVFLATLAPKFRKMLDRQVIPPSLHSECGRAGIHAIGADLQCCAPSTRKCTEATERADGGPLRAPRSLHHHSTYISARGENMWDKHKSRAPLLVMED